MKYHVLLLEDINDSRKGDMIFVAPGFARNFLLPKKLAVLASSATAKLRERLQKERQEQAVKDRKISEKMASALAGQMFDITVKVDPEGHMYGSITQNDIVELLTRSGHNIQKKHVALHHPIRVIGAHQITLKLPEGVEVSIGLKVNPDREIIQKKAVEEVPPTPSEMPLPEQES